MEGMNGEDSCHEGALPYGFRHTVKNEEEQKRICNMKEKIDYVVTRRPQPEQLTVQHMRDPSQGMPVACIEGCESPDNVPRSETGLYMTVSRYVFVVIKIDKIVTVYLPVDRYGSYRKKEAYE
jgi:hypothetical protein